VRLPDRAAEDAVVTAAAAHGVLLDGLSRHWTAPPPDAAGGLVVGFAAPTRADLLRALPVLTDALLRGIPSR
jgi:GntR family transcriptional regulator/MocR family aminotransferase